MKSRMARGLVAVIAAMAAMMMAKSAAEQAHPTSASKFVPHAITLRNGAAFALNLPEGYDISIAAQGLRRVRFLTKAPDGRIFATDMHDLSDNSDGTIYILDGFDAKTGKIARVIPYLRKQRNPNNIAFYTDSAGQTWLYVALTDRLERFPFHAGDASPSGPPQTLTTYPDYGLSYKYGGWHLTRTVAFGQEGGRAKLYVAVGSSCNVCEEKEEIRATVSVMDPDGKNARIIARGLRNAVGMEWVNGALYATNMGADHLGDNAPDDTMFALDSNDAPVTEAKNYGWPYCYFVNGKVASDPKLGPSPKRIDCARVPAAFATFAAHSSPLGLEYFDASSSDPALRDSFLVALHGASNASLGRGYRVVRVAKGSAPRDFITGFLRNGKIYGRPCGILRVGPDAFLLTDDHSGVIYYVHRKAE
ncbi:MAG: hypothetical protein WBF14_02165 [Candidatus Acidiferrales bacterium]